MKLKTRSPRRKPVYFTLSGDYDRKMASVEAACRRPRADMAREWAQERLDLIDFPCLEFRSNSKGRFAVVRGTRLAVWQIAILARELGWGSKLAKHLEIVPEAVVAAEAYSHRHHDEIEALIAANEQMGFDQMKRTFPKLRRLDEAAS